MSWTPDRDVAELYVRQPHNRGRAMVWTAEVEPDRLLAHMVTSDGPECVIDPGGLDIIPAP